MGLNANAILEARDEILPPLAKLGGLTRKCEYLRSREIARITLTRFNGELNSILLKPPAGAKKALQQFPSIGDPGAEKILLFCGATPVCRSS